MQTVIPSFGQDQPKVVFTGTPWAVQGISTNGEWICGVKQETEAYRFNVKTEKLDVIPATNNWTSLIAALDIMDDGTICGMDDEGNCALWRSAEKGWEKLPTTLHTPGSDKSANALYACTSDGKYLVGMLSIENDGSQPWSIMPTLWTKGDDGTYTEEDLPAPETDFEGRKPQWVSPRQMSNDGSVISGTIQNRGGSNPAAIIWVKGDDGKYAYSTPFYDYAYNIDKYKEIQAQEPDYSDYTEGTMSERYAAYMKDYIDWYYRLKTEGTTCRAFAPNPIMSDNGKFIAGEAAKYEYTKTDTEVKTSTTIFPGIYETATGTFTTYEDAGIGMGPNGITDNGDMVFSYEDDIYLLLYGQKKPVKLTEYLKEKYGFDLKAMLPGNLYTFGETSDISADGRMIVARYKQTDQSGEITAQNVYCLLLPEVITGITKLLGADDNAAVYVDGGVLHLPEGATEATVYDISGKRVASAKSGNVDMASARRGIYLVRYNIDGKTAKAKVLNK